MSLKVFAYAENVTAQDGRLSLCHLLKTWAWDFESNIVNMSVASIVTNFQPRFHRCGQRLTTRTLLSNGRQLYREARNAREPETGLRALTCKPNAGTSNIARAADDKGEQLLIRQHCWPSIGGFPLPRRRLRYMQQPLGDRHLKASIQIHESNGIMVRVVATDCPSVLAGNMKSREIRSACLALTFDTDIPSAYSPSQSTVWARAVPVPNLQTAGGSLSVS
jgi:hypothetical protein